MFTIFGLNKTQAWVPMALLLLCCLICPHSSYPHAPEDEDPTDEEGDEDNEENQLLAPNEDNYPEGEDAEDVVEDAVGGDDAPEEAGADDVEKDNKEGCFPLLKVCTETAECCDSDVSRYIVVCRGWVESTSILQCTYKKKPGVCSEYTEDCTTTADCCATIFGGKIPECRKKSDSSKTKACLPK